MTTLATMMAAAGPVATKTEPTFRVRRHLAFAMIGLAHGPLVMAAGLVLLPLMGAGAWTAELVMINELVALSFAAFVAWLAFVVFDTNAGITILPKRWRDLGAPLAAWCIVVELYTVFGIWRSTPAPDPWWIGTFTEHGELRLGWLAAALVAAAAAEEIVYRALLLRALEGCLAPARALIVHAVIFELVHALVYGFGFSGVWFVGGMVLGYAFQRTRSLAVPTLLHAAHNVIFFVLVWYFNQ